MYAFLSVSEKNLKYLELHQNCDIKIQNFSLLWLHSASVMEIFLSSCSWDLHSEHGPRALKCSYLWLFQFDDFFIIIWSENSTWFQFPNCDGHFSCFMWHSLYGFACCYKNAFQPVSDEYALNSFKTMVWCTGENGWALNFRCVKWD